MQTKKTIKKNESNDQLIFVQKEEINYEESGEQFYADMRGTGFSEKVKIQYVVENKQKMIFTLECENTDDYDYALFIYNRNPLWENRVVHSFFGIKTWKELDLEEKLQVAYNVAWNKKNATARKDESGNWYFEGTQDEIIIFDESHKSSDGSQLCALIDEVETLIKIKIVYSQGTTMNLKNVIEYSINTEDMTIQLTHFDTEEWIQTINFENISKIHHDGNELIIYRK